MSAKVRKLFPKKAPDGKEVDALFNSLDSDGGGSLDIPELRAAFKKMSDAFKGAGDAAATGKAQAAALRAKAAALTDDGGVIEATRAFETACGTLLHMRTNRDIRSDLGEALALKGLTVGAIASKWGGDDGEVDKKEFRANVQGLGVKSDAADIDALFDSLDADGGGALDMKEIKQALSKFKAENDAKQVRIKEATLDLIKSMKTMRHAQAEYKAGLEVEAAA